MSLVYLCQMLGEFGEGCDEAVECLLIDEELAFVVVGHEPFSGQSEQLYHESASIDGLVVVVERIVFEYSSVASCHAVLMAFPYGTVAVFCERIHALAGQSLFGSYVVVHKVSVFYVDGRCRKDPRHHI